MATYRVLRPILHNGKRYAPLYQGVSEGGDTIELADFEAAGMTVGQIEALVQSAPSRKAEEPDKAPRPMVKARASE